MIEISEFNRILCDDILINQDWVSVTIIKRVISFFNAILSSKIYKSQRKGWLSLFNV